MKILGYMVIEHCEDFQQPLGLEFDKTFPPEGLLCWTDKARAVFQNKKSARNAITRTDHYRLAFNVVDRPEKRFCKVVPVVAAP